MNVNHQLLYGYENGNDQFTKILMHADAADGSTTFTNSAAGGSQALTAVGNAQVDTAQSKFGGSSALFDGGGDFITAGGTADCAFGTGDFTIDFWIRFQTSVAGTTIFYDSRPVATQGLYPTLYQSAGQIRYLTNSSDRITGGTVVINTWYHIALARQGTNTKLFLDGTQIGSTYVDTNNYLNGASRPAIGANGNAGSNEHSGWIDDLRVSKGVARWTSNFTPWGKAYG